MPSVNSRQHQVGRPSFVGAVMVIVLAAFALAYWWPEITTKTPAEIWAGVGEPDRAAYTETNEVTGRRPEVAAISDRRGRRFSCQVSSVTDGDTLRCNDGERVRLHAVAARETDETCSVGHPCPTASGASARAELGRLVRGGALSCQAIGQSYERVTAICWNAVGVEVNCAMIRSGTAVMWDRFNREAPICRT